MLILKHLVEGQGPVGTLFEDGGTGRHRFCSPCVLPLPWQMYTVHLRDATLLPASGGRGACVIGSHRGVTIRETVFGRLPPPGHCTDTRLRHTPILFVKKAYCPGAFACGAGFRFATSLEAMGGPIRENRLEDAIFMLSLVLAAAHWYLPERSLYNCLELQFCHCHPSDTSNCLVWRPTEFTIVVPQDCICIFFFFKFHCFMLVSGV